MQYATECIILSRKNFQEADRILNIYTKDHGKVAAIAKGVRRPSSRKAGHLEPGSWCKVFLAKGKNLDLITEVEGKKSFGIDNFSSKKANRIYHLLEIVDNLTAHNQKNTEIFAILVRFLKEMEKEADFELLATVFKIKLLKSLGFFSSNHIKTSGAKEILNFLETQTIADIKQKNINKSSYLKLLAFLDSIIESLTETRLKTTRFLNGNY